MKFIKINCISQNKKKHFPLSLSIHLMLLVVITSLIRIDITSKAKYSSESNSDSTVQVASFVYDVKNTNDSLIIDTNDNSEASLNIDVSNEKDGTVCAVSMKYDVVITFSKELVKLLNSQSLYIKEIQVNDQAKSITPNISADNTTYTFSDFDQFYAGTSRTDKVTIIFGTTDNVTSLDEENINVKLHFTQLD